MKYALLGWIAVFAFFTVIVPWLGRRWLRNNTSEGIYQQWEEELDRDRMR